MIKFTLDIDDARLESGIEAALAAHNTTKSDAPLADSAAYLTFVLESAIEAYAQQYADVPAAVQDWIARNPDAVAQLASAKPVKIGV